MKNAHQTRAFFSTSVDANGQKRQLTLVYKFEDSWFGDSMINIGELRAHYLRLQRADGNIAALQCDDYELKNGMWQKKNEGWPVFMG